MIGFLLTAVAWGGFAQAASAAPAPDPSADARFVLDRLRSALAPLPGFSAPFRQDRILAGLDETIRGDGELFWKRPRRLKLVLRTPVSTEIYVSGSDVWVHFPDLRQAERHALADDAAAAALFLGFEPDADALFRDWRVLAVSRTNGGSLTLVPKSDSMRGVVGKVDIALDPRTGLPRLLTVSDSAGNATRTEILAVEPLRDAPDEFFRFTPPPGTEVVGGGRR